MSALKFADSHNMVTFLAKPTETKGFEQIATKKVKTFNVEVQLQALVYRKKVTITETSVRRDLQLEDAEGIECLPNADIFEQLALMGYEKPSQKLTFYKAFFSPQWKFLIHTILQCLSAKSTACMVKNVDSSVKFLMYPRFVQVFLDKQIGDMSTHDEIFVTPSHTKKVFGNMKRVGKGFSREVTPLFPTMMVQGQEEMAEEPVADDAIHEERGDSVERAATTASSLEAKQDSGNIIRTQSTTIPNVPLPHGISSGGRPRRQETMGDRPAQTRVLVLETTKTAQAKEIACLKKRVKKLERKRNSKTPGMKRLFKIGRSARVISSDEDSLGDQEDASKQGREITDIHQDVEVTLVDATQGRYDDAQMFDTDVFNGEEVFVAEQIKKVVEEVVSTTEVSADATITTEEITLAQALAALKSAKPKVDKPSETRTTTRTTTKTTPPPITSSKDKGKRIMVEEPLKMKKKDQVLFDEQEAIRLQAQFDEEERIAREKEEANVALIAQWNDIQDKVETDYELAQRLQAEEQEELTIEEKSKLFQ
ncbi:hypothetical protein Tco_1240590 [Tanacetum coccineum]